MSLTVARRQSHGNFSRQCAVGGNRIRSLGRYLPLLIIFGLMAWSARTHAAEIRCATTWSPEMAGGGRLEEISAKRWPSGRRPFRSCLTAVLSGPIIQGDDERFVRFYRANHPFLLEVLLISPGGNVEAAINIGRLFRKFLITAGAPFLEVHSGLRKLFAQSNGQTVDLCNGNACTCASACALICDGKH